MPRITSINPAEIDSILNETSPQKLHELATEKLGAIKNIDVSNVDHKDAALLIHMVISMAALYEARAVYLKLNQQKS